jgi:Flp pilus assembly protein TadD
MNGSRCSYHGQTPISNTLAKVARYDEALVTYEHAVELDLTYATAYSNMADILEQLGRSEEARKAHEKTKQHGYED